MNLRGIGVTYTVLDYDNGSIREITVIDASDLYDITATFSGREHLHELINRALPRLKRRVRSPLDVAWYAATDEEYELEKAILLARKLGVNVVVTENLAD